jgi:hypothetical protein
MAGLARSAWESVHRENRPVGYGMIHSKFRHSIIESVRTPARIGPYPTGRLFWVALSQALRARLRSHRPSGTSTIGQQIGIREKRAGEEQIFSQWDLEPSFSFLQSYSSSSSNSYSIYSFLSLAPMLVHVLSVGQPGSPRFGRSLSLPLLITH